MSFQLLIQLQKNL